MVDLNENDLLYDDWEEAQLHEMIERHCTSDHRPRMHKWLSTVTNSHRHLTRIGIRRDPRTLRRD